MEADDLLALLSEDWDAQYIDSLGEDCDRPSFMLGYPAGFLEGACEVCARSARTVPPWTATEGRKASLMDLQICTFADLQNHACETPPGSRLVSRGVRSKGKMIT